VDINSAERELLAQNVFTACWSRDSKTIAYTLFRPEPGEWGVAARALSGPERLLGPWSSDSAFLVSDWTRDGTAILGNYFAPIASPARLALWPSFTPSSKPERILMAASQASLFQGRYSPDGRWVNFVVARQGVQALELRVAPAGGAPSASWARLAADHLYPDKPRWTPDGRTVYFISNQHSSFFNLWGVRIDAKTGEASGDPFVITRFDSPHLMISPRVGETEIGIAARRAMLTLTTVTGNIWMLDNVDK